MICVSLARSRACIGRAESTAPSHLDIFSPCAMRGSRAQSSVLKEPIGRYFRIYGWEIEVADFMSYIGGIDCYRLINK